ncbi:MAG: tRNA (adenosine(37)-N6)-dimethylallyltransferase MiaA [Actinobacteria bacterium]|nr:tRNA (adenosine(37)-N6)-dimethylallyltransferase MiaA [Actinomycetota bacterium]MCL6104325.1 tRNA (adenosine(37)-N6)-dimethylallyltransferase MiaA [Actinomycetota bacterium]
MSRRFVLLGPTASGKSEIAMDIARVNSNIELVYADSMCVYKGMDIGTAKPTLKMRSQVPHHLLDLVEVSEEFSVSEFQQQAFTAIKEIEDRGHTAVIVGGTGLYIRAIVDKLNIPPRFPEITAELEQEPKLFRLYGLLCELDPLAAERINPLNRRRITRALEVVLGTGKPFSSFGPGLDSYTPNPDFTMLGISLNTDELKKRIEERLKHQFEAGLLAEVISLVGRVDKLSRTARQALGYKELLDWLGYEDTLAFRQDQVDLIPQEVIGLILRRTKEFARRQMAWFRRDNRINWVASADQAVASFESFLRAA